MKEGKREWNMEIEREGGTNRNERMEEAKVGRKKKQIKKGNGKARHKRWEKGDCNQGN